MPSRHLAASWDQQHRISRPRSHTVPDQLHNRHAPAKGWRLSIAMRHAQRTLRQSDWPDVSRPKAVFGTPRSTPRFMMPADPRATATMICGVWALPNSLRIRTCRSVGIGTCDAVSRRTSRWDVRSCSREFRLSSGSHGGNRRRPGDHGRVVAARCAGFWDRRWLKRLSGKRRPTLGSGLAQPGRVVSHLTGRNGPHVNFGVASRQRPHGTAL
jgi:hypothetical protein